MKLAVCYYPEHWPPSWWAQDAHQMVTMGIERVRIAEFAWSRIEPQPGEFDWAWLDLAVETLHAAGLHVIMCTPTATPPKWLVDADPGMLAVDENGRPRRFGSRRHYCFSSESYRAQSLRICRAVAQRYGNHPAVVAWQTDNEYGCHDTVLSHSKSALLAFRRWLAGRYGSVAALNAAWGTVFWSQEYRSFDEVDLPCCTVTEANPSQRLDFRRFSSDQVVAYNRAQVEVLREHSPGRDVVHNYMGFFTEFDHHDVSADLDVASWDSYPLGFTQNFFLTEQEKSFYASTGHPDIPAFHHDLYRGMVATKRWWVMEQQPGPVNWAKWNPAPANGMVRLWTWQAFAHGAEVVNYFRWRQAPFAQEQMHAGLNRSDRSLDQGGVEATQVAQELQALGWRKATPPQGVQAHVALVLDYPSLWMAQIQPQGADYNPLELCFRLYSALRQLALDVDIVSSQADLSGYALVVLPAQLRGDPELAHRLAQTRAHAVLGPRAGSKTQQIETPPHLAPGVFAQLAGVRVLRAASLPPGVTHVVNWSDGSNSSNGLCQSYRWREDIECQGAQVVARFDDGAPVVTCHGQTTYVGAWLDGEGWLKLLADVATQAGLQPQRLPQDVRVSRMGGHEFVLNFSDQAASYAPPQNRRCLHADGVQPGGRAQTLAPRGISIWF